MKNKVMQKKLDKYSNLAKNDQEKYKFYLVDLEIKEILFKYLEILEDSLKAQLIEKVGANFLDEKNFNSEYLEKRKKFNEEKILELEKRYKKIDEKIFFMELTFGEAVRFFKDLNKEIKEKIVREYKFKKVYIFENWIFFMRYFRNLVCHGENIFNRKIEKKLKGKIFLKEDIFKNGNFLSYLLILDFFNIFLGGKEFILKKIQQKNLPVWGHTPKIEIEAWQVFIQQLYSSFIISQEKKEFFEKNKESNKKTILITGGTGYIGSHGVVAFEKAGYKAVIVDNLSNSSLETLDGIEKILGYKPDFFEVDLRTSPQPSPLEEREQGKVNFINGKKVEGNFSLKEIFEKYNFDGVIHFAGLKAVGESCEKPLEYFDNNIVGSLKLFELMQEFQVKNIVFSSSATVYTSPQPSPLEERGQTGNCLNPYGTTKFILEQILRDLAKFSGFRVANLRYFNPIGAHSSGEIGEDPAGIPNNLLPFIMKVATGELKELKVFGNDYSTVDGTGVRDYIDVVDLIEGHLKAYEKTSPQPSPLEERGQGQEGFFETYNLGVGKGVSVLEMVEVAREVTGKEIPYKIVERRAGDLAEVYCNPEKAKKELDWEAKTSLKDSIKNSWGFYNKR